MKINYLYVILFLISYFQVQYSPGKARELWQDDTVDVQIDRVRELVAFLEYSLNTIGSENTPPLEKDVIITQSYKKFFRDEDVQVEDDLDLNRSTVTNKDVQAYLKDIDFFFKDVTFSFEIEEIEQMVNDSSKLFYLVKLNRNLSGIKISGDSVNQTITRFLEINYEESADDLKIASFYTTKLSEKEDLLNWWNDLSLEWKYIFQSRLDLYDSIGYDELKKLTEIDSLNLSSNQYIEDFEPLFKLNHLRYLDLSNTKIKDLSPLRIHNKLEFLNISGTEISNLDYVKYASGLTHLDAARTAISSIEILTKFTNLKSLDLSECDISGSAKPRFPKSLKRVVFTHAEDDSFQWLEDLKQVTYLDLSFSGISDLNPIASLNLLETLLLEESPVNDITVLSNNKKLTVLNIEGTLVDNLSPLGQLPELKKVYCDNSKVSQSQADSFMNKYSSILIIFDSEELREWWTGLNFEWKELLKKKFGIGQNPEKDELARIIQIDSLDVSGNKLITTLDGIELLKNLKFLNVSNTFINNINAITTMVDLRYLDAGFTNVSGIDSIFYLMNLVYLNLESTRLSSIKELFHLRGLEYLNVDHTRVDKWEIREYFKRNPKCLIIHNSTSLKSWWSNLSKEWQQVLIGNSPKVQPPPDKSGLHGISFLTKINVDSINITTLEPLKELSFLKELVINKSPITDLSPLTANPSLKKLVINQSPVRDISPLVQLENLTHLDISNTGISDIDMIEEMEQIEILKLSGIQIKNLKPLKNLNRVRELDISNTRVRTLKHIEENYNLELLICYNTRLNQKRIENFQSINPDCRIIFY